MAGIWCLYYLSYNWNPPRSITCPFHVHFFFFSFLPTLSFFRAAIIVKPFAHALCIWSSDIQRHSRTLTHTHTHTPAVLNMWHSGAGNVSVHFGQSVPIYALFMSCFIAFFFFLPFSETDFPPIMCARERERSNRGIGREKVLN